MHINWTEGGEFCVVFIYLISSTLKSIYIFMKLLHAKSWSPEAEHLWF